MRWIWIDRFLSLETGKSATALKYISLAEDFFAAHFPGCPVMPAPLMLEGLAQTGGILVGDATNFQEKVVLAKISKAIFTAEAVPGQELIYRVEMVSLRSEGSVVSGTVSADGVQIGSAEIQFAHLDNTRAGQLFGERNFVFDGELKRILGSVRNNGVAP